LRASRQREVDRKSNEITAVPELLDTLRPDAMGCQKFPAIRVLGKLLKDLAHGDPCATDNRLASQDCWILGNAVLVGTWFTWHIPVSIA
jgi:hypothetical protein